MLRENGLSIRDVKTATPAPQPAAQAFVAGQFACATYKPYMSQVRAMGADQGRILATTLQHPCVVDTPAFIGRHPEAVRRDRHDRPRAGAQPRDHGRPDSPERRAVQDQRAAHRMAGPAKNHEYVVARLPELQRSAHVVRQDVDLSKLLDPQFLA